MAKRDEVRGGIARWIERARRLLREHIWDVDLSRLSRGHAFLYRQLRVAVVVVRDLVAGRLFLQASAMTFTSLLTMVPLLVVSFAVIRGLGAFAPLERQLEQFILDSIVPASQSQVRTWVDRFLESARSGILSGVNLIALLAGGFGLLSSMEGAFNDIWGVKRGRPVHQRLPIYLTLIVLGPPLVAIALTLTADLASGPIWQWIASNAPVIAVPIGILFKLTPALLIGIALTLLYTILPHARVRVWDALPAGLTAAVLFELSRSAYASFLQSSIHYSALYGSVASLPIFLVWVHTVWVIVLFGAELTFAREAADDIRDEELAREASARERFRVALHLALEASRSHLAGEAAPGQVELAHRLGLPLRLVGSVSEVLTDAGILHLVVSDRQDPGLAPARAPGQIRVSDVVRGLLDSGASVRHPSRTPLSMRGAPPGTEDPAHIVDLVLTDLDAFLGHGVAERTMEELATHLVRTPPARAEVLPLRPRNGGKS